MAINTITIVEMMWSVIVFFLSAAQIPKRRPSGTEKMTEIIFKRMEYPILFMMITEAATLG